MTQLTENRIPLDDLMVFHQLARSLNSSLDLDTILRTILDQMERIITADMWTLLMLDEGRQDLYYAIASGNGEDALRDLRVRAGEGVAGWVVEHGETLIVPESENDDPRLQRDALRRQAPRALGDCDAAARAQGRPGRDRDSQSARQPDERLHHRFSPHPVRSRGHCHRECARRGAHPATHHHRRRHRTLQRAPSLQNAGAGTGSCGRS